MAYRDYITFLLIYTSDTINLYKDLFDRDSQGRI